MKTIKFRGKSLSTGEWVYGSLVENMERLHHIDPIENHCYIFNSYNRYDIAITSIGIDEYLVEVDPKTVGQYTGFNDCDKKEIYDDDVLQCTPTVEVYRQCVWSNGEYYLVEVNVPCTISFPLGAVSTSHKNAKIIGNIHDNPDLLTKKL